MTEQQNAQRTRRIADAVARGDMKTYGQALGDDVVLHVPGASPLAGDYEGKEGVFGFLGTAAGTTDNTFRFEVFDILASDTRSVARRLSATAGASTPAWWRCAVSARTAW